MFFRECTGSSNYLFGPIAPHSYTKLGKERERLRNRTDARFLYSQRKPKLRAQKRQRKRQILTFPHQNV